MQKFRIKLFVLLILPIVDAGLTNFNTEEECFDSNYGSFTCSFMTLEKMNKELPLVLDQVKKNEFFPLPAKSSVKFEKHYSSH